MSEHLDKVLQAVDARDRRIAFFQNHMKLDLAYAELLADATRDRFDWDGVDLKWKATGTPAIDTPQAAAFFKERYPKLLSTEQQTDSVADPALVKRAFVDGNITAKGQLYRQLRGDRGALDKLAQDHGLPSFDTRGKGTDFQNKQNGGTKPTTPNPWDPATTNMTERGRIYRSDPALAARLAAAVGLTVDGRRL